MIGLVFDVDDTLYEQIVPFEELPHLDTTDLMVVHSCEPTLEEIFIRLTGEKLDV